MSARKVLTTFTLENIPTLDVAVLGALELLNEESVPAVLPVEGHHIVLGSGNALATGKLLFGASVVYGNESNFKAALNGASTFSTVTLISASGGKTSLPMVSTALATGAEVRLLTTTKEAPAANELSPKNVVIFPKNREPYTYNTSTYMSMLAGVSEEVYDDVSTAAKEVKKSLPQQLDVYEAFLFIVPDEYAPLCTMIRTKFDEIFGGTLTGRAFTVSEMKHAKSVVTSGDELFISVGTANTTYGLPKNRASLTLPSQAGALSVMALTYTAVGLIQQAKPDRFSKALPEYCEKASEQFGHTIEPIVD